MSNKTPTIRRDLLQQIGNGEYEIGDFLPSENQLKESYHVSRETVRKALQMLINDGLIQKIRGKGSKVIGTPKNHLPVSELMSYAEISQKSDLEVKTKLVYHRNGLLPDTTFQELMPPELSKREPVTAIGRVRYLNGKPVIFDHDYILKSVCPLVPKQAAEESLFKYFEHEQALKIAYANRLITVETANAEDQKYLELSATEAVVVIRGAISLEDTRIIEFSESRHRADQFQFTDFARRI